MIKIKTQSNTVSITDTAVQATPLVEEEVGHINIKVSKVKMRTRSELATDNIYVTAKNMITLNQIHKGVDDAAVQIYPEPTIVAVPTLSGTYTYTGQEQAVTISTYDPLHIAVSGDTAATNAGTYTVVFSLVDTDADVWEDGTTEDKTATWVIAPQYLEVPTLSGTYTYNASTWYVTISSYDPNYITVSGDTSAVNAGTYTVIFAVDGINIFWSNGSSAPVSRTWVIEKAVGTPSISQEIINNLPYIKKVELALSTSPYGGQISSFTSSNPGVIALTPQQNSRYVLECLSTGTTDIVVVIESDDNIIGGTFTYHVVVVAGFKAEPGSSVLGTYDVMSAAVYFNHYALLYKRGSSVSMYIVNNSRTMTSQSFKYDVSVNEGSAVTIGNYTLFAGSSTHASSTVVAHNTSFVKSNPAALTQAKAFSARAAVGNYALIVGGGNTKADAYNTSLTHTNPTDSRMNYSADGASIGNYALFAGGTRDYDRSNLVDNYVDVYNTSLTHSNIQFAANAGSIVMSRTNNHAIALSTPNYLRYSSDLAALTLYAINSSLTVSIISNTGNGHPGADKAATLNGNAILPAAGKTVDSSLTLHNTFSYNNEVGRGTSTDNFAIFDHNGYSYGEVIYTYVA